MMEECLTTALVLSSSSIIFTRRSYDGGVFNHWCYQPPVLNSSLLGDRMMEECLTTGAINLQFYIHSQLQFFNIKVKESGRIRGYHVK